MTFRNVFVLKRMSLLKNLGFSIQSRREITLMFNYYIKELKDRIIFCLYAFFFNLIFCFLFLEELLYISIEPISYFKGFHFIFTELSTAFFSYLNLILIYSLLLTIPVLLYHFILFITPSLYKYELIFILYFILWALIQGLFALFFISKIFLPLILNFFFKFELLEYPFKIFFEGRIDTYLSFFIKIIYLFNFIFQFPLLIIGCLYLNILTLNTLLNYRKAFYFLFIIVAALLTPPDIISQILLIIPFIFFFETTIFLVILFTNYYTY